MKTITTIITETIITITEITIIIVEIITTTITANFVFNLKRDTSLSGHSY